MKTKRFAIFGTGFWSQFQLGGWTEVHGAECVALYNRTRSKAVALAERFGVPSVYDDAEQLLRNEDIDFVDIITDVDTHRKFTELAATYGKDVICQKPMAPSLNDARAMVAACNEAGVRFYVHENYRWQPQFRRMKAIMDAGIIGKPFRCRTSFNTAFPLFETQPFLAQLEQFALTDQGSHQFDVLRYFFGEVASLYCQTQQVNPAIKGEDVATTLLKMKNGVVCIQEISFSSPLEREVFPQTLALIEGSGGSIRLDPDLELCVTVGNRTTREKIAFERYSWQSERLTNEPPSIVHCNQDLFNDMLGRSHAETTADDNMKTVELVFSAYESAIEGRNVQFA